MDSFFEKRRLYLTSIFSFFFCRLHEDYMDVKTVQATNTFNLETDNVTWLTFQSLHFSLSYFQTKVKYMPMSNAYFSSCLKLNDMTKFVISLRTSGVSVETRL